MEWKCSSTQLVDKRRLRQRDTWPMRREKRWRAGIAVAKNFITTKIVIARRPIKVMFKVSSSAVTTPLVSATLLNMILIQSILPIPFPTLTRCSLTTFAIFSLSNWVMWLEILSADQSLATSVSTWPSQTGSITKLTRRNKESWSQGGYTQVRQTVLGWWRASLTSWSVKPMRQRRFGTTMSSKSYQCWIQMASLMAIIVAAWQDAT